MTSDVKRMPRWTRVGAPYLLMAPALLILCVAVLYPIGFNLFASLHHWDLVESDWPDRLVWLGNYADLIGDPLFRHALLVTLGMTAVAVSLELLLGLGLALAVNEPIMARRLIRTLLLAPILATPLVVALIFRLMWHGEFGIINFLVSLVGIQPRAWLSQPGTAFLAILVTEIWHNTAFAFLVLLGALQMLPSEPYEAAVMDGATAGQRLRHVTLPLLRPAILIVLLFRSVFVIRLFDEVWVLTHGGPNGATETVSLLLYRNAFEFFDVGRAGAISVMLLLVTSLLALVLVRTVYRRKA